MTLDRRHLLQEERPQEKLTQLTPWSWISSLQTTRDSVPPSTRQPILGALLSSQRWLIQLPTWGLSHWPLAPGSAPGPPSVPALYPSHSSASQLLEFSVFFTGDDLSRMLPLLQTSQPKSSSLNQLSSEQSDLMGGLIFRNKIMLALWRQELRWEESCAGEDIVRIRSSSDRTWKPFLQDLS